MRAPRAMSPAPEAPATSQDRRRGQKNHLCVAEKCLSFMGNRRVATMMGACGSAATGYRKPPAAGSGARQGHGNGERWGPVVWHTGARGATDGLGGLIQRWAEWVTELAEHPLDQHEYLGPLEHRDAIAEWLEVHGRAGASDAVGEADATSKLSPWRTHGTQCISQPRRGRAGGGNGCLRTLSLSTT